MFFSFKNIEFFYYFMRERILFRFDVFIFYLHYIQSDANDWKQFDYKFVLLFYFSPHPHVKHYHIKQNSRGEFYLSEKHCCGSIPDLVNYHKHNSGGLASRLKASPCDRPVPATAGLSHGKQFQNN